MAVLTRLELATSAVTGRRSNQLSYSTKSEREYRDNLENCKRIFEKILISENGEYLKQKLISYYTKILA